jgi:hypothetical protein
MAEDYTTIDTPYDDFLNRSGTVSTPDNLFNMGDSSNLTNTGSTSSGTNNNGNTDSAANTSTDNGNVETQPVKSDGGIGDVWIKNFIRSENWQPKKVGFFIDGQTGKAEFSNVFVSGTIIAATGTIGGWTINLTSLSTANIILDSLNQRITVGAGAQIVIDGLTSQIRVGAGGEIIIDGAGKYIKSSNYVSGVFGTGFYLNSDLLEVGNIEARGLIRTAVFQKDVVNVMGGNFCVLDGDALDEDMTAWD